jgi:hypothetical protein
MKCVYSIIFSTVFSATLSYLFPNLNMGKDITAVLYTVSGIMFSIGMSLAVTFKTEGVNNTTILREIRDNVRQVRNGFIWYFIMSTALFIILYIIGTSDGKTLCCKKISFNPSLAVSLYMISSIAYYIYNFIKLQKFNTEIEDELRNEKN